MRGVHDSQMEGVRSAGEAVPLLEQIFRDQRAILEKYIHKDISAIPQVFTPYKEVLDFYDNGLKVPANITLVWPDDNYGYIQRLSNRQEKSRPGGSGVYYHASYWGRPHDYLWLSTTHPALIREEMMKAFDNGADRLWVLNVGDIKPLEYNIQLFLDMAYDPTPFKAGAYTRKHILRWTGRIFGKNAAAISNVLLDYYDLAFERRPEFMGWSQTEPITPTAYTAYDHFYYGDEAQRRIDAYDSLERTVERLRRRTDSAHAAAFYELVYYPVVCAAQMNRKFIYRDKAYIYAKENRISASDYAARSMTAYRRIVTETGYFNDSLANGKWVRMMSMDPRDLPVFQPPVLPAIRISHGTGWGVAPEGADTISDNGFVLPQFTKGLGQSYFIDVFLSDSAAIRWKAIPSAPWITLSATEGALQPEQKKAQTRLWVRIDWTKAPHTRRLDGQITFTGNDRRFMVKVPAFQPPAGELKAFTGCIETNGYISIFARHFALDHNPAGWRSIPGLGHTGASMLAATAGSYLTYDFYTFTGAAPTILLYALPTLPLNRNYKMRCAVRIDGDALHTVDFSANSIARTPEWKQNVLSNTAVRKVGCGPLKPGKHTLKIYAIDPGVILDRLLIDLGGLKPAYGVIPETKR